MDTREVWLGAAKMLGDKEYGNQEEKPSELMSCSGGGAEARLNTRKSFRGSSADCLKRSVAWSRGSLK